MTGATNAVKLMAIDFKKKDNRKMLHNIDIGFAASSICKTVTGVENLQFKEQCCLFLQHLCGKLAAKCPLNYKLVKGVTCLDPQVMLKQSLRQSRVSTALEVFVEKKWITPSIADTVKRDYEALCEKKDVRTMLEAFKRDKQRLDELFHTILDLSSGSGALKTFVCQILTLFHGNAAVERRFSINKECLVENLLEESLIGQRVVYDAVSSAGGVEAVDIPKAMIHAVRNASAKRVEAEKKKVQEEDAAENKRKHIAGEIKVLEAKKARIVQTSREEAEIVDDELKKLRHSLK